MHLAISSEYAWNAAPRFALTGAWFPPAGHLSGVCTCGCDASSECDGLAGLSDAAPMTGAQAMQAAMSAYAGQHLNTHSSISSAWLAKAASQVEAGAFDIGWYSPTCGAPAAPNLNLFQTASGLAVGTSAAGVGILAATHVIAGAAAGLATAAIAGVGVIFAVIDIIFEHHAAAVKRDLAFGCAILPAVNNSFQILAQGVAAKQITPDVAAQAVWEIYSNFMKQGGASGTASGPGSIPGGGTAINNSPYCNSNCEMSLVLYAMCLYWSAKYQAMAAAAAAAAAASAASSSPTVPSSGGSYVPTAATPGATGSAQGPAPVSISGVSPLVWLALAFGAVLVFT